MSIFILSNHAVKLLFINISDLFVSYYTSADYATEP